MLDAIASELRPAVEACGAAEIAGLLRGLAGRFVAPGPSGAPTRGRPEVLPTGRNFYSLDSRAVPTPAAWQLGWKSAQLLVERHAQEHGSYPRRLALSAWGTSNMRTGGDDIAQALALMGVRPHWEAKTGRVIGFEIMPASVLDRPRVDVTLRVSGFFRDAFPNLIELVDSAARAVAALDEPAEINPLAARVAADRAALEASGIAPRQPSARRLPRLRRQARRLWRRAAGADRRARLAATSATSPRPISPGAAMPMARAPRARPSRRCFATASRGSKRWCRTRTIASTICSTATITISSRAAWPPRCAISPARRRRSITTTIRGPENPRIRTLEEEIGRVVHARAVNPKWLNGVMRHGYKGAFEMAATVDYSSPLPPPRAR